MTSAIAPFDRTRELLRALDLDGNGEVSYDEIREVVEDIDVEERPNPPFDIYGDRARLLSNLMGGPFIRFPESRIDIFEQAMRRYGIDAGVMANLRNQFERGGTIAVPPREPHERAELPLRLRPPSYFDATKAQQHITSAPLFAGGASITLREPRRFLSDGARMQIAEGPDRRSIIVRYAPHEGDFGPSLVVTRPDELAALSRLIVESNLRTLPDVRAHNEVPMEYTVASSFFTPDVMSLLGEEAKKAVGSPLPRIPETIDFNDLETDAQPRAAIARFRAGNAHFDLAHPRTSTGTAFDRHQVYIRYVYDGPNGPVEEPFRPITEHEAELIRQGSYVAFHVDVLANHTRSINRMLRVLDRVAAANADG